MKKNESVSSVVMIVIGIIFCMLCIRFSAAYFSYVFGVFFVFCLYDFYRSRKERLYFQLYTSQACRYLVVGMALFYGLIIVDNLLIGESKSAVEGMHLAGLTIPFFMILFLGSRYAIRDGVKWGIMVALAVLDSYGLFVGYTTQQTRFMSVFVHPNEFAQVIMLVIPFLLYFLAREKDQRVRILLAIICVISLFCLYKTAARGPVVGLFAGAVVAGGSLLWLRREKIQARALKIAAVTAAAVLLIGGGMFWQLQSQRTGRGIAGGERIPMLYASYEIWNDHKLFGVGLLRWQDYYYSPEYHPKEGVEKTLAMPHNMPAYFFSTTGLLGGLGYTAFMLLSLLALYRQAKESEDDLLSVAVITIFWAFFFNGMVNGTLISKTSARLYFALLGYYFTVSGLMAAKDGREEGDVRNA